MQPLSLARLHEIMALPTTERKKLSLKESHIKPCDLSGANLSHLDFEWSDFSKVTFDHADLSSCILDNCRFETCSLKNVNLANTSLIGANMRFCDLTGAHIEGANLYDACLEYAKLDHITDDDNTQHFRLHCPDTGPFLGYKKCCNDRLVQLLIPADALRTSATANSCRCNKAKVLSIKSFDYTQQFDEAWSLVDPDFVYRVGEWVEVKNFNTDRWMDSTTGIHYWLTREEAKGY